MSLPAPLSAVVGTSIHEYVRLLRLRRAAYEMAFRDRSVVDVALGSGYGSHAAFSRAFKKVAGQSPSQFRAMPRATEWFTRSFVAQRAVNMQQARSNGALPIDVVVRQSIRLAALEHRGDPAGLKPSLRRFIAWRKQQPPSVRTSATFNFAYGDPRVTPAEDFRFEICSATDRPVAANQFGVIEKRMPAGRFATLRHLGSNGTVDSTVARLRRWLHENSMRPRDFPLILHRVALFPDVPEHEAITDVLLALA